MSYFVAALVALIAGETLMVAGYGFPAATLSSPETLILVHVIAIGWMSLLLCGALFQFLPVLVAHPLYSNTLPLPALLFLLGGLALLLLGFLQLAGDIAPSPSLLPFSGLLLGTGFMLVLWNLGRTLWAARPISLPAQFVTVGLTCLAVTVAFGVVFTIVFGGMTSYQPFQIIAGAARPIHAIAGIGGWLTFTAAGVSYRLLAMFMLAPELEGRRPHAVLYLGAASLALIILAGLYVVLFGGPLLLLLAVCAVPGIAALAFYGADIFHLYRVRKRRNIELNSRMAAFALMSLAGSVVLTIGLIALGRFVDNIGAVVFLVAFGWLTGLSLAKLYKITAFMTWLECYGPVLGKTVTPRVQDLVIEARARKWFFLYFFAVWFAELALLAQQTTIFRIGAAMMLVATAGIVVQLARSRFLKDVNEDIRLPEGTHRPKLFLSHSRSR